MSKKREAQEFKNVFDHWQNLKPLFSPVAIRLLMPWFALIPILVTVFRDAPETVALPTDPQLVLRMELPFRWWLLWLASLLFTVAFALFHIFCPKFMKRYSSYVDYLRHEHSPRWLAAEFALALPLLNSPRKEKLFERLVVKKLARQVSIEEEPVIEQRMVREHATVVAFDYHHRRYLLEVRDAAESPAEIGRFQNEVFWEIFGRLANTHRPARYLIWVLLLFVLVLISWAILQSIVAVLNVVLPVALQYWQ